VDTHTHTHSTPRSRSCGRLLHLVCGGTNGESHSRLVRVSRRPADLAKRRRRCRRKNNTTQLIRRGRTGESPLQAASRMAAARLDRCGWCCWPENMAVFSAGGERAVPGRLAGRATGSCGWIVSLGCVCGRRRGRIMKSCRLAGRRPPRLQNVQVPPSFAGD
jgi:hypothetical protein